MKYSRFEQLVLGVGVVAILGTVIAAYGDAPIPEEVFAQFLLLGVLVGAVHWGRKGGFLAAAIATVLYVVVRIPLVVSSQGLTPDISTMIVTRALTYGLVGVLGGELCSRIRYVFVRLEDNASIDEWTHVYNQRFMVRALANILGQHTRYGTVATVVLLTISPTLLGELRPTKQRKILRSVANLVRNDVRIVDEVGRLEDGRFLLILPHTPRDGGLVAADRVRQAVQDLLGAKPESVSAEILGAPEDLDRLQALLAELRGDEKEKAAEEAARRAGDAEPSGAYAPASRS